MNIDFIYIILCIYLFLVVCVAYVIITLYHLSKVVGSQNKYINMWVHLIINEHLQIQAQPEKLYM